MTQKPAISLEGRWILVALFLVCCVLPEIWVMRFWIPEMSRESAARGVVRLIWGAIFFFYMMRGQNWARYLTIAWLGLCAVLSFGFTEYVNTRERTAFLIIDGLIQSVAVAILLWLPIVRRKRSHWE